MGGTPEVTQFVRQLEIPLSQETAHLVQIFHADRPLVFDDVDQSHDALNRDLAHGLGASSFLGTPLMTKGRRIGILAVDNGLSGRPIPPTQTMRL